MGAASFPVVRLQKKNRPDKQRARKLLQLHTRPTTDFDPETKRLLAEAKATNFGKPIKPVLAPKKTKRMEFQEAKARLLDTTPSKREQKLIDSHLQRAVELERDGNSTEAAFYREHADTVRKNCVAIREVFAENVARHEKEIAKNLTVPPAKLMVKREQRIAQEKAAYKKVLADAKANDSEKPNTVNERLTEAMVELRTKKKGVK